MVYSVLIRFNTYVLSCAPTESSREDHSSKVFKHHIFAYNIENGAYIQKRTLTSTKITMLKYTR